MNEQQRAEFYAITNKVIEWMNNNCHPHMTIIIDCTSAELLEGVCAHTTTAYVKD